MTPEQQFFYKHAGFSYNPRTQSKDAGRRDCARNLAAAEALYLEAHRVANVHCEWESDPDGHTGAGNATGPFEQAMIHRNGDILAALCGIDQPDDNYRRVVRAELAQECAEALREAIARANSEG